MKRFLMRKIFLVSLCVIVREACGRYAHNDNHGARRAGIPSGCIAPALYARHAVVVYVRDDCPTGN
jgi:transposase